MLNRITEAQAQQGFEGIQQYVDRSSLHKDKVLISKLEELLKLKNELAEMGIIISDEIKVDEAKENAFYSRRS